MHAMPNEIEMLERFMLRYRKAISHLGETDDVTLKVSLNLNPEFTDWETSELKPDYFIDRFNSLFNDIKTINEIRSDTSLMGTTQQKRESIELDYDQFIFCDPDIITHELLLKTLLAASSDKSGMYIISPSLPKWWDYTWNQLCHSDYLNHSYEYAHTEECVLNAETQSILNITIRPTTRIKFGCGMYTLYSKEFWKFIGIPESLGGYGPEDTYAMNAASLAIKLGYDIKQFVTDGIYITEDLLKKISQIEDKTVCIDVKSEMYSIAKLNSKAELVIFGKKLYTFLG